MPAARLTKDEKEHIKLSWWLLERKIAYYRPEAVHENWGDKYISPDDEYDEAEVRYLTLCRKLGRRNTLVHKGWPGFADMLLPPNTPMMEIDETRPSVKLVLAKLGSNRWARR